MTRRITDLTRSGPPNSPAPPPPLFGPGDDDAVPGEIVLTLEPDAAAGLGSVPALPQSLSTADSSPFSGTTPLQKALDELSVRSVARVHGPSPAREVHGIMTADDLGLDTTLLVTFDPKTSPKDAAERLGKLKSVSWAEPNRWRQADAVPDDPRYSAQWGLRQINAEAAWEMETGDPAIVVGVIDTGVDLNHPDLAPLLVAGRDFVNFPPGSVPKPGWVFEGDYTTVDNNAQDEVGHGTHVAGTICSLSDNGIGVAGVAWNVRLMPLRVLARVRQTATGRISGLGSSADTAAAIRWAADHGTRVINLSLGSSSSTMVEREAVAYAVSQNVVVVAAMGNDDSSEEHFPAAYPDVIAVAATDRNDHRSVWTPSQASNTGSWVDISAPGTGIVSTDWNDTYSSKSGTSMATPHVAGAAALVLSRNQSLSAAEVGDILRRTARPLRDDPGDPVPNDTYGHGLLQLDDALNAARPPVWASRRVPCVPPPSRVCPPPSRALACPPSTRICPPSRDFRCPSVGIINCPTVRFCPSARLCPSQAVCPSRVGCPSLACPTFNFDPGTRFGEDTGESWTDYDPHGFDPYGPSY